MKIYFAKVIDGVMVEAMWCNSEHADTIQTLLGDDWVRMYEPR